MKNTTAQLPQKLDTISNSDHFSLDMLFNHLLSDISTSSYFNFLKFPSRVQGSGIQL